MSHYLSVHERHRIVTLHEDGLPVGDIARRVGVARNTVTLWINRWDSEGHVNELRKTGRPTVTNAFTRNEIVRKMRYNGFFPVRNLATDYNVSQSTVRRILHTAGIHHRQPAKKLALTALHKEERLRFARDYLDFDFENVIFSDEKTFSSDECGRITLWRINNTRYLDNNIVHAHTSGRINLGFWGWMSSAGPGELIDIGGRLNAQGYVSIMQDVLIPTVMNVYPGINPFNFVHDNSSVHTARATRAWFREHNNEITALPFPPKSPDMNPIENLWGLMVQNWDPTTPRTAIAIRNHVFELWEHYRGMDTCKNMVMSMRERLQCVIDNAGGHTRF